MSQSKKVPKSSKSRLPKGVAWQEAPDIKKRVEKLITKTSPSWQKKGDIFYFRSSGSKARAYARIWGLGRIWQQALNKKPSYVIEVISERFDNLSSRQKNDILLHELAHIPKTFSGSLVPHFKKGKRRFRDRVKLLQTQFRRAK